MTFVFTDIEGSTPLFERLGAAYEPLQERHRELLRHAWAEHGGHEIGTEGDSFFVAFADPAAALRACIDGQRALAVEPWPADAAIRVRMGVHSGPAEPQDGNYTSLTVHAAARVMAAGNGGQIVVSAATRALLAGVEAELVDCGLHQLRGFQEPVRLFLGEASGADNDARPLRTSRVALSNLPPVVVELVGRDDAVVELGKLIREHRLVTITGTGGVGKTRLALATAGTVADDFPDGSWFVDLHALRSADDVVLAVARLLQVADAEDRIGAIARSISAGRVLLLLDNCEHVLEGASAVATAVLALCPNAAVLVTSREPLGVAHELTWRAPSLNMDDAVALLVRRIAETRGTAPSAEEHNGLKTIARRLDGIPLALELAAARAAALSAPDVAARLDERFRLLGASRGSLSRHQTLEAAVAWSVDLLDDLPRAVFRRLSVFAGGWTLDAAEAVVAFGDVEALDALDALQALVDKSLVHADFDVVPARYSLLETIRQFAQAELLRVGEAGETKDRHLGHFADLFVELDRAIPGPTETRAVARADGEYDNLQAALDWAEASDDPGMFARLVNHASHAIGLSGRYLEVAVMVERALAAIEAAPERVPLVDYIGVLRSSSRVSADHMHANDVALERAQLAWDLAQDAPEVPAMDRGICAGWLSTFLHSRGRHEEALRLRELAVELVQDHPAAQASSLGRHGQALAESTNDREAAKPVLLRALQLAEQHDSAFAAALARTALGFLASMRGDRAECIRVLMPLREVAQRLPATSGVEYLSEATHFLLAQDAESEAAAFVELASDLASASGRVEPALFAAFASGSVAAYRGDMARAEYEWGVTADLGARQGRIFHAMIGRFRLYWLYDERGDRIAVRRVLEEARPYAFELGWMPQMAWLLMAAEEELLHGDPSGGLAHVANAVDVVRRSALEVHVASVFDHLSDVFFEVNRFENALRLQAAASAHITVAEFRTTGSVMRWRRRCERDAFLTERFPSDEHARLVADGQRLTLDDAYELVERLAKGIPD